jgi:hypothetical protein
VSGYMYVIGIDFDCFSYWILKWSVWYVLFLYELVYAKYSKVLMWFIYNIFVGLFGDDMLTRRAREGVDALEKN